MRNPDPHALLACNNVYNNTCYLDILVIFFFIYAGACGKAKCSDDQRSRVGVTYGHFSFVYQFGCAMIS